MALYAVYGRMHFSNRAQRNRFQADVEAAATQYGFRAEAYDEYPAGAVPFTTPLGDTGLTVCYVHEDYALIEQAAAAMEASGGRNGRRGDDEDIFGTGEVSPGTT